MPRGLREGCGAFSAADPVGYSQGSAGLPASQPPVRHIPMPPFRNSPFFNAAGGASQGAQPLSELRSLRSLRPLPTPSSSSLRSDSLSPGPSPCPCPGVDRSSRGWLLAACLEGKLLGAEDAVTGIAEAGDNVGVVV